MEFLLKGLGRLSALVLPTHKIIVCEKYVIWFQLVLKILSKMFEFDHWPYYFCASEFVQLIWSDLH
jgi:hypothetical protein